MISAIIVFLLTYSFIVSEKGDRAVVSLLGALTMILIGVLRIDQAFIKYIEWNTITLLIGMMILVGITNQSGVFEFLAIKSVKWTNGKPIYTLLMLSLFTAIGSAVLDNVTTVLLVVPVTLFITEILGINPTPFLLSEIISSNIGGTATLIGDPPNIMIGMANPHLTFNQFIIHLAPIAGIILGVTLALFYLIYRKKLIITEENRLKIMALEEKSYIKDKKLLNRSLSILGITIIGFSLHSQIHIEAPVIALTGAALLMAFGLSKEDVETSFQNIEWTSIFFFIGLFTLVGGLQETGAIKKIAGYTLSLTEGNIPLTAACILWGSGVASAIVDNIPFVTAMIPLIQEMTISLGLLPSSSDVTVLWWALALGACLGGNGTLVGASANIIVATMAARKGKSFSYIDFMKLGAPITILSLLMSHVYIYLRYLL